MNFPTRSFHSARLRRRVNFLRGGIRSYSRDERNDRPWSVIIGSSKTNQPPLSSLFTWQIGWTGAGRGSRTRSLQRITTFSRVKGADKEEETAKRSGNESPFSQSGRVFSSGIHFNRVPCCWRRWSGVSDHLYEIFHVVGCRERKRREGGSFIRLINAVGRRCRWREQGWKSGSQLGLRAGAENMSLQGR